MMKKLLAGALLSTLACEGSTAIFVDVPAPPDSDGGSARAMQAALADDAGSVPDAGSPTTLDPPDAAGDDAQGSPDPAAPDAGPLATRDASMESATDAGGAPDAPAYIAPCYDLTKPPSSCIKLGPQSWCESTTWAAFDCPGGNSAAGSCDPAGNSGEFCCPLGPGLACP
jgi:hypothetical protein